MYENILCHRGVVDKARRFDPRLLQSIGWDLKSRVPSPYTLPVDIICICMCICICINIYMYMYVYMCIYMCILFYCIDSITKFLLLCYFFINM